MRWRVLAELCGDDAPQREEKAADALGLLALVAGQDVEPAQDSEGTDGRWRIARKVTDDRVISTVDPETRHTRKSKSVRKDGYRGHVAAEPETGLITDCEMTKACGQAGSDPVVGEQMISRDRYHQTDTQAAAHPQPADDEPAGPEHAGQQPAEHQAADQANAAAEPVADSRSAATDEDGEATGANTAGNQRSDASDNEQSKGLEVYGDSAYGTGAARAAYRAGGHDTVIKPKPLRPAIEGGFTLDDFDIDEDAGTLTCPARYTRQMSATRTVTFGKICADCPLRARCTTAKDGRSMTIHPHEDLLRAARAQARTPQFKRPTPPARTSNGSSPGPPPRTGGASSCAISASPRTTPGCVPEAPQSTCASSPSTASPTETTPGPWPDRPGGTSNALTGTRTTGPGWYRQEAGRTTTLSTPEV